MRNLVVAERLEWVYPQLDNNMKYDVALSFAGEQRDYVAKVAGNLQSLNITIFYDRIEEEMIRLWGGNLAEDLHDVYENKARFVVMFISKEYVEKAWTTHERRSALSGAIQKKTKILPVRFDDTPVPGLPTDVAYLHADGIPPQKLALFAAKKLDRELLPEFNIHKVEDKSFGSAKRLVYRIEVPNVYSEAQGHLIAEHIVETKHRTGEPVNAVGFFFYFPVADPNGPADGSIDWAPNGRWADAITVRTGDYRSFRFTTEFWKERTPQILYHDVRTRMEIYRKIVQVEAQATAEAESKGGTIKEMGALQWKLSEQYKDELVATNNLSRDELLKITVEGFQNNWPSK